MARRKRRLCSGEKRDTAPLLSMLPTSRTLTVEEVEQQITSLLGSLREVCHHTQLHWYNIQSQVVCLCHLSQVLGGDVDSIEHLLHCCLWSKDSLIQHYLDHPESLRKEAGLSGDPPIPPPTEGEELVCPVCLLSVPTSEMLWLWCNHACCKVGLVITY